jgi:hypothetical protein
MFGSSFMMMLCASNWVEVVGRSGNLTLNGSDSFQYRFYKAVADDPTLPLDWISVSHYGGHARSDASCNFPCPDYVQRTPHGTGAASVASFVAAVVTEIYLCNVCSCQEILIRNGRA